ncbi:hypothetical protein HWV62_33960 [Athelia sp. TMB]|nr:hypothetical protein HWV62_33960 [Athelia sp. TMB]
MPWVANGSTYQIDAVPSSAFDECEVSNGYLVFRMEIDFVSATRDILIHDYLQFFATTILIYDHYLTFPAEIDCIWARPKGLVSWLFIANRYLALFGNIAALYINLINLPSEVRFIASFEPIPCLAKILR